MNTETNNQGASGRHIPVPPAGGSWSFDESKWAWISNDPAPSEEASAAAAVDMVTTEQEQGA
ncbi:hypothetical protein [Massilia aerilata]|uniref:Uncharacterized protein n=1 Tax=Massilia aerilata TaxID=453817 RepID=A0ABW0RY65_9BURK